MGYRDQVLAARAQVDVLRVELERTAARARHAETERARLARELDRLRNGASREQALRDDPHFTLSQVLLPVSGLLGALYAVALRAVVFRDTFYGSFDPTPSGLANLAYQLDDPEAWASALSIAGALLLAALPLVASAGLLRRRKWGWALGTVTYALWALFCPPLGLYGLFALCRGSMVQAFFSRAEAAACGGRAMIPNEERGSRPPEPAGRAHAA